ncbi:DNA topoisomerase III [Bacillus timonensis]|nr:DNA topoisomerase III [Bacillus timonensis]
MNKAIVLAEKPSVARDIASVLKCQKKGNGFFEGDRYIVTWALGHLVTHAEPEGYDQKYKQWKLEDLPMLPNHLKLVVIKQTGKQFNAVKTQLNRTDVKEIIIATDAGREGELVARWIIEKARVHKPIKRLWISSVTDKAIKAGFASLRDGKLYENLFESAVARAEADWYVGINATRALTCKFNAQLSCGRVQTPTLAMIAAREEEIKQFNPVPYYGISLKTEKLTFTWQNQKSGEHRIFDSEKAEELSQTLKAKQVEIVGLQKAHKKRHAAPLYDLTELQRDAHHRYHFSAKETLSILQKLYEQHKLVTYPRTDSRYLSTDIVDTLKDRVEACRIPPYQKVASQILQKPIKSSSAFVDDRKVSDHHAIIPTEQSANLSALSHKESKIYDLIVKRFLAVLLPPFEYEQTTISAKVMEETFIAKGKKVVSIGWKELYQASDDEDESTEDVKDQIITSVNKGDTLPIQSVIKTSGQTSPPPRFNEGTLLTAMENPAKFMNKESKDLIKAIGDSGGIGTVATRADIIEKLFNSFLIEKKGKELTITNKGKQLLEIVPEELKSPALTAQWEQKLELIAKGSLKKEAFIKEIIAYAKSVVHEIKNSSSKFKHDNVTGTNCPDCGKLMLEVNGKKGKMLVCQDRDCGHRKNIAKVTNARCPNCRKRLELRGEGEGQMFTCKCGHREKLSTFNERRQRDKQSKVSKKDVAKYLKKQDQDEPINTALADALAKLNLKK